MGEKYLQIGLAAMLLSLPVSGLEKAAEAYDRMMSSKARFRVVLTTGE